MSHLAPPLSVISTRLELQKGQSRPPTLVPVRLAGKCDGGGLIAVALVCASSVVERGRNGKLKFRLRFGVVYGLKIGLPSRLMGCEGRAHETLSGRVENGLDHLGGTMALRWSSQ